jgi:hypothetical protein
MGYKAHIPEGESIAIHLLKYFHLHKQPHKHMHGIVDILRTACAHMMIESQEPKFTMKIDSYTICHYHIPSY